MACRLSAAVLLGAAGAADCAGVALMRRRQFCYRLSSLSWHRAVSVANLVFSHADDEHEDIKQRFFGLCLLDIGLDMSIARLLCIVCTHTM